MSENSKSRQSTENLQTLPKRWVSSRLGDVAEIVLGQSPPSSTYNENENGLPFYQGKLEFGNIYPSPQKWCTEPKKIAEKGDVLISVRAPVGPTNICPERSCIGRGLAAIRGLGEIKTFFILYLMRAFEHNLTGKKTGTTFDAITGNILKEFVIPLPPLLQQHRIVAKIEELFTKLDAGVAALKKAKAQLKHYRQAVLKAAVEGKLTKEWREACEVELEPASVLLERIEEERKKNAKGKYKELPPLDTSNLSQLPENWIWTRLGEVGSIAAGGTPSTKEEDNFNGEIPWVTPADLSNLNAKLISRGKRNLSEKGLNSSSAVLLPKGTILFSSRAPIGYVAIAANPISTNQGFKNMTLSQGLYNEYVFYYLKASKELAQSFGSGTTFLEVSASRFGQIPIPLPPLVEQRKIVEKVERCLSIAEEVEAIIEDNLKRAQRLRQSILKRAFSGKLAPQDPSDEPASVLLERIKKEKAKREADKKSKKIGRKKKNAKQMELILNGK